MIFNSRQGLVSDQILKAQRGNDIPRGTPEGAKKQVWTIILAFIVIPFAKASTCETSFNSLSGLFVQQTTKERIQRDIQQRILPRFIDPKVELSKPKRWNRADKNVPKAFNDILPDGVQFIGHQLVEAESSTAVKLASSKGSVMARASYSHKGIRGTVTRHSNVLFSSRALVRNLHNKEGKKWLVSRSAQAAILYLHGMGMQSGGAHIASRLASQFKDYPWVEVLSLDLPFHGEGPRNFVVKNLAEEVFSLAGFAQKYIPPHVPLFVFAHSGSTVFAQQLMSMTDGPTGPAFFHPGLKGIMLFSPIVDPAPGRSPIEKQLAFVTGQEKGIKADPKWQAKTENTSILATPFFEGQNPVGELYGMWAISQWSANMPAHGGAKYIPTLMAMGTKDELVYTGFDPELFRRYYDKLSNVQTHYIDQLPLLKQNKVEEVGHVWGIYKDPQSGEPIQVALARTFMEQQLGHPLNKKTDPTEVGMPIRTHNRPPLPPFVQAVVEFSHDLAFRTFLREYQRLLPVQAHLSLEVRDKLQTLRDELKGQVWRELFKLTQKKQIIKRVINIIKKSDDKTQVLDKVRALSSVPENIQNVVEQIVTKATNYFDLKRIAGGELYVPLIEDLSSSAPVVRDLLAEISQKQEEQYRLKGEIKDLQNKKEQLIRELKPVKNEVLKAIALMESAVKEVDKKAFHFAPSPIGANPDSEVQVQRRHFLAMLTTDLTALKHAEERARQAREHLVEVFEDLAPKFFMSANTSGARPPQHILEDFLSLSTVQTEITIEKQAYQNYQVIKRRVLSQMVQAILKGFIGDLHTTPQYQQAALDLYGPHFDTHIIEKGYYSMDPDGLGPRFSTQGQMYLRDYELYGGYFAPLENDKKLPPHGPLYVKLSQMNAQLAEIEADLIKKTVLFEQGIQEYQGLMAELLPFVKPPNNPEELDLITVSASAYKIYNVSDVLNKRPNFETNNKPVISRILNIYQKQLNSSAPLPLPFVPTGGYPHIE